MHFTVWGPAVCVPDMCQMDVRWMSDGCQMDVRWMSDGCQMDVGQCQLGDPFAIISIYASLVGATKQCLIYGYGGQGEQRAG